MSIAVSKSRLRMSGLVIVGTRVLGLFRCYAVGSSIWCVHHCLRCYNMTYCPLHIYQSLAGFGLCMLLCPLQGKAVEAVKALVSAMKESGHEVQYHVLDTHAAGYYKNPNAKIDIALSASTKVRYHHCLMPIWHAGCSAGLTCWYYCAVIKFSLPQDTVTRPYCCLAGM